MPAQVRRRGVNGSDHAGPHRLASGLGDELVDGLPRRATERTEQLAAMDMKRTLPGSNLAVMGLPLNFDGQRPHPHSDSPKLGQHNSEVFG